MSDILVQHFSQLALLIFWIYAVGATVVLILVTVVEYGKIKKPIWRSIASAWTINFVITFRYLSTLKSVNPDGFLMSLNKSGLVYALAILVYVYFAVESWGYEFRFNSPTFKGKRMQLLSSILILRIMTWTSFFKVFSELT